MKYATFGLAVLAATQASAADVEMNVDNFRKLSNGSLEIVVKFTNNLDKELAFVRATCAFLNKEMKAVTTENVVAQNIAARASDYGKTYVLQPDDAEKADCQVTASDY